MDGAGTILTVEASMHAPYDKQRKTSDRAEPKSGVGFLILPAVVALVLIVLATFHPKASIWISEAVQAEFGGYGTVDDTPVQTAQPGMAIPMRTVHAE
jgi:hypothetical protein